MIAAPPTVSWDAAAAGAQRFIRYGFMPNRLGYCGPGDHRGLFDYGMANAYDAGLRELIDQFAGAMPYLRLIARANGIADPLDERVVEAYWLGSPLLNGVSVRDLYDHLAERFKTQLSGRVRELVLGKAPAGARPCHAFHVLDVHSRAGDLGPSLATIDGCRISWGRVVDVLGGDLLVQRQPLELSEGKIALAAPVLERAVRQIDGRGFAEDAGVGDWVSLHWGWVCEVLSERQRANLERFTRYHLTIANQTV